MSGQVPSKTTLFSTIWDVLVQTKQKESFVPGWNCHESVNKSKYNMVASIEFSNGSVLAF
jgi:hypothetical protein